MTRGKLVLGFSIEIITPEARSSKAMSTVFFTMRFAAYSLHFCFRVSFRPGLPSGCRRDLQVAIENIFRSMKTMDEPLQVHRLARHSVLGSLGHRLSTQVGPIISLKLISLASSRVALKYVVFHHHSGLNFGHLAMLNELHGGAKCTYCTLLSSNSLNMAPTLTLLDMS